MSKKIRSRHYYTSYVIDAVRDHQHEDGIDLTREDVQLMEPEEVLKIFLEWEGIIGYTGLIENIVWDHVIDKEEYEDED